MPRALRAGLTAVACMAAVLGLAPATPAAADGGPSVLLAFLPAAAPTTGHERPDVLVLDLMLPGVNGWDFVEHYREFTAGEMIPIIVVSAAGAITRSMEAQGVRRFVPKPFEMAALTQAVDDVLRES